MGTFIFAIILLHLFAGFGYAIYKISFSSKKHTGPGQINEP